MQDGDGTIKRNSDGTLEAVAGHFNYQKPGVTLVKTRRDATGSDAGLEGADWDGWTVLVHNARLQPPTVAKNGFQLVDDDIESLGIDFLDDAAVTKAYYPECERLLKAATGAVTVKAFDHNVRSTRGFEEGKRLKGGNAVQQPAPIVHGDYTATSAPRRVELLGETPKLNDVLRPILGDKPLLSEAEVAAVAKEKKHFALMNVWRNISLEPVRHTPLACCDAQTQRSQDFLTFEIHYADRVGENYFARHSDLHKWFYFPEMRRTEAMLIKQWDSNGALAQGAKADASDGKPSTFTLHSAFKDPMTTPDTPSRESIEVRCVLLFDD